LAQAILKAHAMLQVELDHILPEDAAFAKMREIINHVEQEKEVYVITKDGRPMVAIVNVDQLATTPEVQQATATQPTGLGFFAPAPTVNSPEPEAFVEPAQAPVPPPLAPAMPVTPEPEPSFSTLPPLPPLPDLNPPLAEQAPQFSTPLPPFSGAEQLAPPAPTESAAPAPQLPGMVESTSLPPTFTFPKEDLGNSSPLG
jgi:hypothetical protein